MIDLFNPKVDQVPCLPMTPARLRANITETLSGPSVSDPCLPEYPREDTELNKRIFSSVQQALSYLEGTCEDCYSEQVDVPLTEAYSAICPKLSAMLRRDPVLLFDMGPGVPNRSRVILESLARRHPLVCYVPVDLNPEFLYLARRMAQKSSAVMGPLVQGDFSEVGQFLRSYRQLEGASLKAVYSFGSTMMNISLAALAKLTLTICLPGDVVVGSFMAPMSGDFVTKDDLQPYVANPHGTLCRTSMDEQGEHVAEMVYRPTASPGLIDLGFDIVSSDSGASGRLCTLRSYRWKTVEVAWALRKIYSDLIMKSSRKGAWALAFKVR
jgi:hypothetical protein